MENLSDLESNSFALVTLKERCNLLKEQLNKVDEENVKLKVQIASGNIRPESGISSTNMLVEQVETLKKQNNQLTSQMHILAAENSNMWNRLSKFTVINQTLNKRLLKISETLEKHGLNSSVNDSDLENCTAESRVLNNEIEDVSKRVFNGISLEKTQLEEQYSPMAPLHGGSSQVNIGLTNHDLAYSYIDSDEDNVLGAMRKHAQKINQLKQTLAHHNVLLLNALDHFKNNKIKQATDDNVVRTKDESTETGDDLPDVMTTSMDRRVVEVNANEIDVPREDIENMCPLCGNHIAGGPKELTDHVSDHFEDELDTFIHIP